MRVESVADIGFPLNGLCIFSGGRRFSGRRCARNGELRAISEWSGHPRSPPQKPRITTAFRRCKLFNLSALASWEVDGSVRGVCIGEGASSVNYIANRMGVTHSMKSVTWRNRYLCPMRAAPSERDHTHIVPFIKSPSLAYFAPSHSHIREQKHPTHWFNSLFQPLVQIWLFLRASCNSRIRPTTSSSASNSSSPNAPAPLSTKCRGATAVGGGAAAKVVVLRL